ncbi:MAG: hypothetical protein C4516_09840 [Oxalobacter sp.]|nr:MAG: hypothetical protein C4516_09840 [Oxalobacter sp.]
MKKDDNPIIQESVTAPGSGLTKEEVLARLREKMMQAGHPTVKQEYGTPQRGVETGLDEAFVIDRATYEALIKSDPKSEAILKPFANAKGINRWRTEPHDAWLINTVPGTVNIDDYPAIRDHLTRFRDNLEKRGVSGKWFELAKAEHVNPKDMSDLKLVYQESVTWPGGYALDQTGAYYASSGYHLRNGDYYIAGLLNSKLYWFLLSGLSPSSQDGTIKVEPEHLEVLPVPRTIDLDLFGMIGGASELCHKTQVEQVEFYDHVLSQMATHLAPNRTVEELSPALRNWHILSIDTLQEEAKRLFGKTLGEDLIEMWEGFLNEAKYEFNRINSDIARGERQIDFAVCHMFGLGEEEIEFIVGKF